MADIGIVPRGAGADNVRNVTGSATAGIDLDEPLATRPHAKDWHHHVLNTRAMHNLPRKFNVAFDGAGKVATLEDTNDIGFQAVRVTEDAPVPAGMYDRLAIGGISGHKDLARDTGVVLPPGDCIRIADAVNRHEVEALTGLAERTPRMSAAPQVTVTIPDTAPFSPEQRSRLSGFFAGSVAATAADGPVLATNDEAPWHDPSLEPDVRMGMARDRPIAPRLMAAMAQQDGGQCGYDCADYANAIALKSERRLKLCAPGGKVTARLLKGLAVELNDLNGDKAAAHVGADKVGADKVGAAEGGRSPRQGRGPGRRRGPTRRAGGAAQVPQRAPTPRSLRGRAVALAAAALLDLVLAEPQPRRRVADGRRGAVSDQQQKAHRRRLDLAGQRGGARRSVEGVRAEGARLRAAGGKDQARHHDRAGDGRGAFPQGRKASGAPGRNWLFFGHQRSATDFFYRDELEGLRKEGVLTRLSLAWSRDAGQRFYVQDRMREVGADLWRWLEEGAHVYVCGDARRMAKDVEAAVVDIAATAGGKATDEAVAFVSQLKRDGKFQLDVY